jgi:hypothetical protein
MHAFTLNKKQPSTTLKVAPYDFLRLNQNFKPARRTFIPKSGDEIFENQETATEGQILNYSKLVP